MQTFDTFNLIKPLQKVIADLGFSRPTPIQAESFSIIRSGKDVVGISQTGTGKTLAYMLPVLQDLKFSKQPNPRVLVFVPTRELVLQMTNEFKKFAEYTSLRIVGVYGGVNINTQKLTLIGGVDILVATPGRLFDLVINGVVQIKGVKKLIIDEVDVMLDLGFRPQLTNIFELLPQRRQNIMFSATMTQEIEELIEDFFIQPVKISIALSGTPLDNIAQSAYLVSNFYTKVNLLNLLLTDKAEYHKVLIFTSTKKIANRLFEQMEINFAAEIGIIHSNKSQNNRLRTIENFETGKIRILITTDVMARGLDLDLISHVINLDTPTFSENYIHRIGRTGRAETQGKSILLYTEKETLAKEGIEMLMDYRIPLLELPDEVEISKELIPDELPVIKDKKYHNRNYRKRDFEPEKQEKKEKNQKTNQGGSYRRELAKKYKKPKTKGDKNINRRKKK